MQAASDIQTKQQLDQLAQQGKQYIRNAAIERNRPRAINNACLSLWLIPIVSSVIYFAFAELSFIQLGVLIGALLVVPVSVYVISNHLTSLHSSPSRQEALALYDAEMGLKDALQIADEYFHKPSLSAFEQAALHSCGRALNQAITYDLAPRHSKPLSLSGIQYLQVTAAMTLGGVILTAVLLHNPMPGKLSLHESGETDPSQNNTAVIRSDESEQTKPLPQQNTTEEASKPPGVITRYKDASDSVTLAANATISSSLATASTGSPSTKSTAPGTQPEADAERKPQEKPRQTIPTPSLASTNQTGSMQAGAQSASTQSGEGQESQQPENAPTKQEKASLSESPALQQGEQQKDAALTPSAPAAAKSSPRNAKKQQDSGKKNNQQQSSGSQQNSNSQNSNTRGDDAQKKSRGINQLMLAIPMEDQFIGTPGPGLEKTTTEDMPSEEKPYLTAPSASRGTASHSTTVHQKPITQGWEKHMMNAFFRQQHQTSQQNENTNDN